MFWVASVVKLAMLDVNDVEKKQSLGIFFHWKFYVGPQLLAANDLVLMTFCYAFCSYFEPTDRADAAWRSQTANAIDAWFTKHVSASNCNSTGVRIEANWAFQSQVFARWHRSCQRKILVCFKMNTFSLSPGADADGAVPLAC